jgi:class 3 adenylate cyclase/tetratricopeptide (TPR) repeat protein
VAACSSCGAPLPGGARFCPNCAAPVSRERPSEERKLATVLFADLVGSTEMADAQDAERTRALLNRFYDAMAAEIAEAGGTIEKFIGDAVVAAFGAPIAQEDHADRALHAALSMGRTLEQMFGDTLRLRIGVNTGDVIVGAPRVGSSFVTGDAVNVAARLEQGAKPGEILVGERTVSAVRIAFEFGPATTIEAKGKESGVACRQLLRAAVSSLEVSAPDDRFVGREQELQALRGAYRRALETQRPVIVSVLGEPGIGKTTLVREFRRSLGAQSPAPVHRTGRCRPFGQASAYSPLGDVVGGHPDLTERWPILGIALGQPVPPDLHPLEVVQSLRAAWVEFLDELAARGPLVVLVEDLHWAEPELLELLGATGSVRGPLLVLGTARDAIELSGETIALKVLPSEDASRIVDGLAKETLAEDLHAFVVERSDGNPLFVEEIMRMLADRGVTDAIPEDLVVPDTVQALLGGRIDLLAPAEKAALQAAAVIGRTFRADAVRELISDQPRFDTLAERGFVRGAAAEFVFMHALTREVAYGSLTTPTRARLHARYAEWLEVESGGRDEDAAALAHHYAEGVRPEDVDLAWHGEEVELGRLRGRAVAWLRRAATLAAGRYEMREAVALLERAVELEADPGVRGEIWEEIAHANVLYFDGRAFASAMEEAIALAEVGESLAARRAELAFQTMARAGMWGTPPPSDLVGGWISSALELAPPGSPARAKALVARCYSDYDKSAEDAAEASQIAERAGEPLLRSYGYDVQALVSFVRGEYPEALEWCRRRAAIAGDLDDPDAEAFVYSAGVNPAVACGELGEARRYALLQQEVTSSLSPHHRLHGVSGVLELEELLGDWPAALALQGAVHRAVVENRATPCVRNSRSLLVCALAHAHLGNGEESRRLEQEGEANFMTGYGTVLDTPRLLLALHRGDLGSVESLLGEPAVRTTNWFYLSSMAAHLDGLAALGKRERVEREAAVVLQPGTYLEPFAVRALGLVREDETLVDRAAELFEAFGLVWHAARTRGL